MDKKTIILSCFLAMAGCVSAQSLTPEAKEIECGQILFRTPSTITIALKNNTSEITRITNVDTGCGCTAATFSNHEVAPGQSATVNITFDGKQLGHFERIIRVFDDTKNAPSEVTVRGQVVTKVENFAGNYPYKMGELLTDVDNIEFDDVNKGQHFVQEIHIMNPTGQNVQPTALRLPPYLTAEMHPEVLGPKQKGTMYVSLKSQELRDYGLTQTSIYLGKTPADKVMPEKEITVSAILLPPAVAKDDVTRPYAAKMSLSSYELDMTALAKKSKVKDEIVITNNGKSDLEISKLQMFTTGLQVELSKSRIAPGESSKLKVTGIAKELKKVRTRPRILMITNDPDRQKVLVTIKK
ncbi:MAG: DUF1573 domain-containing protein [Prevotella sp.]|nr:DUF1573 domain-containing protein [Candidatus Prevotella equi]